MRIDLSCPVELWRYRMTSNGVLAMQIFNLAKQGVTSIQVCVLCVNRDGMQFARRIERVQGLQLPSNYTVETGIECAEAMQAAGLDIRIERVWFEDGTVWRRTNEEMTVYEAPAPLDEERLALIRQLAGADAAYYPTDQGTIWTCVCGRANTAHEENCIRCHRDKHDVFTRFSQANVETVLMKRKADAEEEENRRLREQQRIEAEIEQKTKHKKHVRRVTAGVIFAVLLVGALAYGVYFHGIPYYRYYTAGQAMEKGDYDIAIARYEKLADYRDSAEKMQECAYRRAQSALDTGTMTGMQVAWENFEELGDYSDAAARAQEARYRYAEQLLANGKYEEASAAYALVKDYADSTEKMSRCRYLRAEAYFNEGDYASARTIYLELGDWDDSAVKAQECLYRPGDKALSTGDPVGAAAYFAQLGDYRDSTVKLQQACYDAGTRCYDEGDWENAADYFLQAGEYLDAYRMATACLYAPAQETMDAGDYVTASEMFEKISGYQDSHERALECRYYEGIRLMESGDYAGARVWLEAAEDYAGVADALNECVYQEALAALENGDKETAESLFGTIAGYRDADARYGDLIRERANAYAETGDLDNALATFEQMGEDGIQDAQKIRYTQAIALIENMRYEDAIAAFSALDGYENSEEYMDEARYLMALDFKVAGNYSEAGNLFSAISGYSDADIQYKECEYAMAEQDIINGSYESAVERLTALNGYRNSADMLAECAYRTAEQMEAENDLGAAAAYFRQAGNYKDAVSRAAASADAHYAAAYDAAVAAAAAGDHKTAADVLEPFMTDDIPEKYEKIPSMYREACYQCANKLYTDGKPFEALLYYRKILDYGDVADKKLNRTVYRLIGTWESAKGTKMIFRDDGTCSIDGKEGCYNATQYALHIGDTPDTLKYTYNVSTIADQQLVLLYEKTNTYFRMQRVQ